MKLKVKMTAKAKPGGRRGRAAAAAAATHGFGRDKRLLKHSAFDRVYTSGRRQFSPAMTAFYLLQPAEKTQVQVGFTAGRAVGKAVERNRIRRRMREAVRRSLPQLQSALQLRGLAAEIVFNPRRKVLEMDFSQIEAQVARVFQAIAGAPPTGAAAGPVKEQA